MSLLDRRLLRETSLGLAHKFRRVSWVYVLLLCLLAGVGFTALYAVAGGSLTPYAGKQALRFAVSLVVMLVIALTDIRFLARLSWPAYAVSLALLALVLRVGHVGKGAERWIDLAGVQWQPSEMMKIALVMALAAYFRKASWEKMGNPLFLLPPALMVAAPVALILKEPNLGTAVIVAAIGAAMFLAAGIRWWKVGLMLGLIAIATPIGYAHLHAYQRARITTFLHPERDPLGAGYNIIQSKIALGAGGMWGQGFLHGSQGNLDFLPEKQTDFIFAILAEEFGYVGSLAVLGLLAVIVAGALAIALGCKHRYGRLLAVGIGTNFFLYVI